MEIDGMISRKVKKYMQQDNLNLDKARANYRKLKDLHSFIWELCYYNDRRLFEVDREILLLEQSQSSKIKELRKIYESDKGEK